VNHIVLVLVLLFPYCTQKNEPSQDGFGKLKGIEGSIINKTDLPSLSTIVCHFTEEKHQHHDDDDSGMGPSTFTDTKTTINSEVSYYLF